jgi:hypothetical protein
VPHALALLQKHCGLGLETQAAVEPFLNLVALVVSQAFVDVLRQVPVGTDDAQEFVVPPYPV